MSLRSRLIGLAGTLMLAVSPTAIVLAQDTQSPTVETPTPARPSPEDVIKRHKQQEQQGVPAGAQTDDGAPAMKPKRQKPDAAQQNGAGEAPNATEQGSPAMKPKRQKPDAAQQDGAAPAPDAVENGAPAMKPRRQKPASTTETPAPAAQPTVPPVLPQGKPRGDANPPNPPQDGQAGAPAGNQANPAPQGRPRPAGQGDAGIQGGPQDQTGYPDQQGGMPRQGQGGFMRGPVNPAANQRATALLNDNTPPDSLNDQQLRQRLNAYRGALAAGNLSPDTEQALIQRLNGTRAALRNRVAGQEFGGPKNGPGGGNSPFGRPQFQPGIPGVQDVPAILADRRPSTVLDIDGLNRRILVYRDAANDHRYSPQDRAAYVQFLQADRAELRRRLMSDRIQRMNGLRQPDGGFRFDMNIAPRGPRQPSIWAAEVDDEQIEQQFASRPLQPLPRRYSRSDFFAQPEIVMEQPAVRQAIPSVELDTIHFGFNEAFIREEETANLDRVGRIIERIVAAHPDEVFVIEGNTDAVGDDAYNMRLSKARAEAVKQALTQYYVISPDNLVTAGLGERYLKIPTPEPEQENRRVTIRRVTPLLMN